MEFVRRAAHLGGVDDAGFDPQVGREPEPAAAFAVAGVVQPVDVAPFEACILECRFKRSSLDLHGRDARCDPKGVFVNAGYRGSALLCHIVYIVLFENSRPGAPFAVSRGVGVADLSTKRGLSARRRNYSVSLCASGLSPTPTFPRSSATSMNSALKRPPLFGEWT